MSKILDELLHVLKLLSHAYLCMNIKCYKCQKWRWWIAKLCSTTAFVWTDSFNRVLCSFIYNCCNCSWALRSNTSQLPCLCGPQLVDDNVLFFCGARKQKQYQSKPHTVNGTSPTAGRHTWAANRKRADAAHWWASHQHPCDPDSPIHSWKSVQTHSFAFYHWLHFV